MKLFTFLALVAMATSASAQSPLSSQERAIVASVDANQAQAIDLLERAVNINSGTMNLEGVRKVGALFRAEFDALGFTTTWVDLKEVQRAGHLVAERKGRAGAPKVLLIGHLDTVFEADSPFQKFERLDGNKARGPGVTDMKGGDVIILLAIRALKDAALLDSLHIVVVMTGEEESAGRPLRIARKPLIDAAQGAIAAIGFEDGDGHPDHIVTARRGTTNWELTVKGKPAHSSQIFRADIGYGAIFEATRVLQEFRAQLAGQKHLTFNPGMILGGTSVEYDEAGSRGTAFGKSNVIAEHAVVSGDMRALTPEQFETARQTMERIASTPLGQTTSTLTFDEGYPPLAPTEGNATLLAMLDKASRDLGLNPVVAVDPDRAGAADVSFVAAHVPMIIDALGLKGDGGHTVDEIGLLDTVAIQAKRAAVLLSRLASQRQ
ncbi:MAG: M20/M25/M40 family metallo-hydrolase [Acidobacteriota bacterium]|nr:M20/M25/M40 family metallo-hydrolase [Acidobacteriota bacterium]